MSDAVGRRHFQHVTGMSRISSSIPDDRRPVVATTMDCDAQQFDRRLEWVTWAFVVLGVLLRLVRYAMDYPLWWDEAFVAVNFIRRDYLDLLRPLDYGQVCPILFLWAELTLVKLLGFSEWSLRLFPLVCAIASRALPPCGRPRDTWGPLAAGSGDLRGGLSPDPSRRRRQALCLGPAGGSRPVGGGL